MARRALSALLIAFAAAAVARSGQCAPPSTLRIEVTVCPGSGLDAAELRRSLSSELEADGVVHVALAGGDGTLTAEVGCDAALTTHVALSAAHGTRSAQRSLVLADADPSARSRVLALAASELVRSDWPALSGDSPSSEARAAYADAPPSAMSAPKPAPPAPTAATPPPAPALTSAPPSPSARSVPPPDIGVRRPNSARASGWAVSANAHLRWFVDYGSFAAGADAGPDWGPFRLRAELLLTRTDDVLGSATVGSGALCFGYQLFERQLGPITVAGYPLASAGITWLRGTSASSAVQSAPATGFYGDLRAVAEARWSDARLSPVISAEVGRATGFVARASDRVLGATGGFFVGASAGGRY